MDPLAVAAVAVLVASLAALRRARRVRLARTAPETALPWTSRPAGASVATPAPVYSALDLTTDRHEPVLGWISATELVVLRAPDELLVCGADAAGTPADPWDASSLSDTLGQGDGLSGYGPEHRGRAMTGTSDTLVLDASGSRLSLVDSRATRADDEGWS